MVQTQLRQLTAAATATGCERGDEKMAEEIRKMGEERGRETDLEREVGMVGMREEGREGAKPEHLRLGMREDGKEIHREVGRKGEWEGQRSYSINTSEACQGAPTYGLYSS